MSESALREAVERLHDCKAKLREVVAVSEHFGDADVWEGEVHVFDLDGHPTATTCYAWSSPVDGTERRKFYAVLQAPPVTSPLEAVRAAIVADQRGAKDG